MKWLPPFFTGILLGAGLLGAIGTFFSPPKISLTDWKTLQARTQAQTLEIARQQKEIATKSATIAHLQKTVAPSPVTSPAPSPGRSPSPLAGLAALMDTPAMKKMMAAQQERLLEATYADLIAPFHFTPDERAQFVKLLSAKQAIDMEMGLKLLKLPPEERKKMVEQEKAAKAKADADIREFFNDEKDFAAYNAYTQQQTQNYQMEALRPAMKFAGEPLTAQQEKTLGEIMRTAGKDAPETTSSDNLPSNADASTRMFTEQARRQQRIAESAARILSPAQLEVLRKSQASQLQMMKASTEMSQSLLGE